MEIDSLHAIRIYIIASHSLFAQGVSSLLEVEPDIQVVGLGEYTPETLCEIEAIHPDVAIIDTDQSRRSEITDTLLKRIPGLTLVGLSLAEENISITYLQQKTGAAVEDLVAAVRSLPSITWFPMQRQMRILAAIQGVYGQRVVENIQKHAPTHWNLSVWRAPPLLPPEQESLIKLLPKKLSAADLVLGLVEGPHLAFLLPEIVTRSGARALLAPVENSHWMPASTVEYLKAAMGELRATAVLPKPFCSLTMRTYNEGSWRVEYRDAHVSEFARYFGRPEWRILFDTEQIVTHCEVRRDVACGLGTRLSEELVGCSAYQVEDVASRLLAEHYCPHRQPNGPVYDPEYQVPLHQVTDAIVKDAIRREIAPFLAEPLPQAGDAQL